MYTGASVVAGQVGCDGCGDTNVVSKQSRPDARKIMYPKAVGKVKGEP